MATDGKMKLDILFELVSSLSRLAAQNASAFLGPPHATTHPPIRHAEPHLDRSLIRKRHNRLWLVVARGHRPLISWLHRLPLQEHLCTIFLRLSLLRCVLLHTGEKLVTRA